MRRPSVPGAGSAPRGAGDDVDVALLDEQGGGQEGADPRPVGRDLRPRPPAAIGVLIEAVARPGGLVDAGEIDADAGMGGRGLWVRAWLTAAKPAAAEVARSKAARRARRGIWGFPGNYGGTGWT